MFASESATLDFSKLDGLAPIVLQHAETREPLMVGFVNEEAWSQTLNTGMVTLYRRTLGYVLEKGADSGADVPLRVLKISIDCDDDTALLEVLPDGPICHDGQGTCFTKEVPNRP